MHEAQYDLHAEIEDRHWWFAGRRAIVKRLLERVVPPRSDALIIDVGCGTGANLAALAASYRCLGIDESAQAIDHARTRFPKVEFVCQGGVADGADRFSGASAVLLMDVLEHVEDDVSMLSQVLAPLQPGTNVIITVPADESLWSIHDESFGHWRRYDLDRLRATWAGLPVEERLVSYYNARLFPVIKAVRTLSRWRGRPAGRAGTDFAMPPKPFNGWLEQVFAGEARALEQGVDSGAVAAKRGASLIAILRRSAGEIAPRQKPAHLGGDRRHR